MSNLVSKDNYLYPDEVTNNVWSGIEYAQNVLIANRSQNPTIYEWEVRDLMRDALFSSYDQLQETTRELKLVAGDVPPIGTYGEVAHNKSLDLVEARLEHLLLMMRAASDEYSANEMFPNT